MKKKILVVTPKFPYPTTGACEKDRAAGLETFLRLGYEVYLISKAYKDGYAEEAKSTAERLGCTIVVLPYKYLAMPRWKKMLSGLARVFRPWYLDGAAFEYAEPEIRQAVKKAIDTFQPDVVWFDYTYLWPLYTYAKKKHIPIITRSINFEPRHFLEEEGVSLINLVRYLPMLISEILVAWKSDCIAALNPNEAKIYSLLGAKKVFVLPLRALPPLVGRNTTIHNTQQLHVLYMSSTYRVAHNKRALLFLLKEIIPRIHEKFPNQFIFHFCGSKLPPEILTLIDGVTVKFEGFIAASDMESFLASIDIAVSPSSKKVGMQQKVFEPLVRGIPLITSPRNMVGYPFFHKQSVMLATTPDEYIDGLELLRDRSIREKLSKNAVGVATTLFLREIIDSNTQLILDSVTKSD